jgi:hypothetical protein
MSGYRPPPAGPLSLLGMLVAGLVECATGVWNAEKARSDRAQAARKALEDERASRAQQRQWYEAVARQQARGHAGFASEAEARAALSGRGGRPSNLDGRKF